MIYVLIALGATLVIALLLFLLGSRLPQGSRKAVNIAFDSELPNFAPGKHAFADAGGVKIWFESFGDPSQETVLLIMGHSCSALVWPPHFYQPLVDMGYHVIRYDNRGVGLSDWMEKWGEPEKYNLEDMALDALAVLDAAGVEKAHIVGASMGGMIGQRIALNYPERVFSLTSIMSTGFFFDPELRQYNPVLAFKLGMLYLRYGLQRTEKSFSKLRLGIRHGIAGSSGKKFDMVTTVQETIFEIRNRNGFNVETKHQHGYAIKKSGSRLEELKDLSLPTLVVHGTEDPLVAPAHGKKYAALIPGVEELWVEGMGHTFPKQHIPAIMEAMQGIFSKGSKEAEKADLEVATQGDGRGGWR